MQDIKRELRDREIQTQTQGHVLRFESPLYIPAFTQKDFRYVHQGPSTLRNYNLQTGNTQLQLSHTSIQEGRHKAKHKVKKEIQLSDYKYHKLYLVISKDHKQNTSHNTRS